LKVKKFKIEECYYQNIKNGKILLDDGQLIRNEQLTYDPPAPMSYAFCSDTVYNEEIVPFIANVTVLYHEATFCSQRNVLL
jgi:ribonuclease Z